MDSFVVGQVKTTLGVRVSEKQTYSYHGPLYEQVHRVLRARIEAGEWQPRETLPGEAQLSLELGVSVGTVRKAMDQLTRENIVMRERGRGTFVRGDAEWRSNTAFRLLGRDGRAIAPQISLIDCKTVGASEAELAALRLRARHRSVTPVLRLDREWRQADELLCRETIVVDAARFPRLGQELDEAAETLFQTYADIYRSKVERVQWTIGGSDRAGGPGGSAVRPDDAFLIRRTAFDARGVPMEACEQRVSLSFCQVQICR